LRRRRRGLRSVIACAQGIMLGEGVGPSKRPRWEASLMTNQNDFEAAVSLFRGGHTVRVRPADLEAFLELTQGIDLAAAQRLRRLAIALERRAACQRGWEDLQVIYQRAAELAPNDATVFHSWGISATDWVDPYRGLEMPRRLAVASEAEWAFLKALDLSPRDSRMAYSLGLLYYEHPLRETDEATWVERAISWFTRAVEWDSGNVIAQLYLAHCYHDQKDWPRAICAYEKIDQATLARDWPLWRAVKCREQLAH